MSTTFEKLLIWLGKNDKMKISKTFYEQDKRCRVMVSMKEIAAMCNVSVATVSKALNNHTDISDETKTMIRRKADELGYVPNPAARALKTHTTYNIGVLFYDEAHTGLTHEFFASILEAVKETAELSGYDITFISHFVGGRKVSYAEHSRYRRVDGVVIVCANFDDPEVIDLVHCGLPVVTIDHTFDNCSAVMSDNVRGMRDIVNYVYQCGHRRIAFLHGAPSSVTSCRLASFYRTCEELGLQATDDNVIECDYHDIDRAEMLTRQLMQRRSRPTCIIYPDDITAISGISVIRDMGYRVPDDVSVVGYDGIAFGQSVHPKLTTLKQDVVTMGSDAAHDLIDQIEHPKSAIKKITTVPGMLIEGGTLAKLPVNE